MSEEPDGRSPLSIGMDWGTRITALGLEFAVPAFLGFGFDRWAGTAPWLTLLGAILGLAMGMIHLLRLAAELTPTGRRRKPEVPGPPGGRGPEP